MKNMKNIVLIFFLCLSVFMISCNNSVSDTEKAEQVFGKEIITKYKDYDKKPAWDISRDIIQKLKAGEYSDIEEYIDYLIVRKPYTIDGTRVLEDIYQFIPDRIYSQDIFDKWCAEKPSHHSSFIFRGYYFVRQAWKVRGSGFSYTVSEEGWLGFKDYLKLAEKDFEKAYSMNPEDPNSAAFMITVCMGLNCGTEEMDVWFKRAVNADPIAYNAYGRKHTFLAPRWCGTGREYRKFTEYCLKKTPEKSTIHEIMLEYIMDNAGDAVDIKAYYNDPSIKKNIDKVYEKTIKNFPDSVSLRMKLAKIETKLGNYDKALEQYSEALVHDPGNPATLLMRGNVYLVNLGKYDLAEVDYKKSFESDPGDPVIYYQLAEICAIHDDFVKADEYYTRAIELRPRYNRFFFRRGFNRMRINDNYAAALEDFKEAEKLDYLHIETNRHIAICLEKLNRIDEAKEYCRKTLDLIEREKIKGDGSSISAGKAETYTKMLNSMIMRLTCSSSSLSRDDALQVVNEKKSGMLYLGITSLTPEIAEILIQTKRGLAFTKLESISTETAKILAQYSEDIDLTGLKEIDYTLAYGLAGKQKSLDLSGLKKLSGEAAKGLCEYTGKYLKLNGLETLTPDAAAHIARCNLISLNGLTDINNETIIELCNNRGGLYFEGILQLPPEKARLFAKHEGDIWFMGLTELSPDTVKYISKHKGFLGFPRVKSITLEEAVYFGKHHKGGLNLGDITYLSDDAARALYDHDGKIEIYNLTSITPAVAELLLKKARPNVSFKATSITPEVAGILAKHEGALFLSSLTELDAETAMALSKHQEEVSLNGVMEVIPEVMEIVKSSHGRMRLNNSVKVISKIKE